MGFTSTGSAQVGSLSLLRQSGDIDVWIEGGVKAVVGLAQKLGQKTKVTEQHVDFDVFPDTEVEAHFIPTMLNNRLPIEDCNGGLRNRLRHSLSTGMRLGFVSLQRSLIWCTF